MPISRSMCPGVMAAVRRRDFAIKEPDRRRPAVHQLRCPVTPTTSPMAARRIRPGGASSRSWGSPQELIRGIEQDLCPLRIDDDTAATPHLTVDTTSLYAHPRCLEGGNATQAENGGDRARSRSYQAGLLSRTCGRAEAAQVGCRARGRGRSPRARTCETRKLLGVLTPSWVREPAGAA
jgi:hypothetical protein